MTATAASRRMAMSVWARWSLKKVSDKVPPPVRLRAYLPIKFTVCINGLSPLHYGNLASAKMLKNARKMKPLDLQGKH